MEDWELNFLWLKLQHYIKDSLGGETLPDLRAILLMIGIQEFGEVREKWSKEEKQDLMHVAVCSLLEDEGYYEFVGRDEDNWPHWEQGKRFSTTGIEEQERLLKTKIVGYFDNREKELELIRNNN